MTQFNLADELRRGGTGLLAQAVADMMLHIAESVDLRFESDGIASWLAALQARAAAVPAGNAEPCGADVFGDGAFRCKLPAGHAAIRGEPPHSAYPAGNQTKAPTALDEMRARPGATGALARIDWEAEYNRMAQAECESREALARVEAERDRLDQMLVVRHLELRKRDAVIEATRSVREYLRSGADEAEVGQNFDKVVMPALSALDQAASEAEVAERAIVVDSIWLGKFDQREREVTNPAADAGIAYRRLDDMSTHWTTEVDFRKNFTWVSDPEATESATKETT